MGETTPTTSLGLSSQAGPANYSLTRSEVGSNNRNQCCAVAEGLEHRINGSPSPSALAFCNRAYIYVTPPFSLVSNSSLFVPWGRLALLMYVLQAIDNNNKKKTKTDSKDEFFHHNREDYVTDITSEASDVLSSWNSDDDFCCHLLSAADNESANNDDEYYSDTEDEEDSTLDGEEAQYQDDDSEEDDDDDFIQFESQPQDTRLSSNPNCCSGMSLRVPPPLYHISSFSSEESGFCGSNEEEDEEYGEEEENCCFFDEGLWHEFEQQGCFNDLIQPCPSMKRKKPAIRDDSIDSSGSNVTISDEQNSLSTNSSGNGGKVVSFKPDCELVKVHYIIAWRHAYKMARKGPWEQLALDRDRFQKRIDCVHEAIGPCLLNKLRCMRNDNGTTPPAGADTCCAS